VAKETIHYQIYQINIFKQEEGQLTPFTKRITFKIIRTLVNNKK
jgi:hypothetical protein